MKSEENIVTLNHKSSSEKGSIEIASTFTERLDHDEVLQNPWVIWKKSAKELGQEIYNNRNRRLSGLIIGVKDVISTLEFPTRMGADYAWQNPNMGFDARVVAISKELGAVVGGKTKTSEFAVHQETDVINPKYPKFTAGTSSAGSAAAVANGTVDIALATQTAGSIARPASYCGVVGFKPTFGDFPRTGVLKTTDDFDTVGIIGRNVSLIQEYYMAVRLGGTDYPLIEERRQEQEFQKFTILTGEGIDSSNEETSEKLYNLCKQMNLESRFEFIPPEEFQEFHEIRHVHETIYRRDLFYYFQSEIKADKISTSLTNFINAEDIPKVADYKLAKEELVRWQKSQRAKLKNTLLVSLSASSSAPITDQAYEYDLNAVITAAGLPQLSIPCLVDENGGNINVSLSGSKGSDFEILSVGTHFTDTFDKSN